MSVGSILSDFLKAEKARDPEKWAEVEKRIAEFFAESEGDDWEPIDPSECTIDHRGPEGPNEDLAQCRECWSLTFAMRPEGETFGWHIADCSLPLRHESYCKPGGAGHQIPEGENIRGYFPPPAQGADRG